MSHRLPLMPWRMVSSRSQMTPRRSTLHQNANEAGAATYSCFVSIVRHCTAAAQMPTCQHRYHPPRVHCSTGRIGSVPCRCQEKNRRAQARFRERQKAKAAETGEKVAGLEEALQRLQQEKLTLQSHAMSLQMQLQQVAQLPAAQQHSLAQPAPASLDGLVSMASCRVVAAPICDSTCLRK